MLTQRLSFWAVQHILFYPVPCESSSLHSRVHVFDKEQRDPLGATSLEKVISR